MRLYGQIKLSRKVTKEDMNEFRKFAMLQLNYFESSMRVAGSEDIIEEGKDIIDFDKYDEIKSVPSDIAKEFTLFCNWLNKNGIFLVSGVMHYSGEDAFFDKDGGAMGGFVIEDKHIFWNKFYLENFEFRRTCLLSQNMVDSTYVSNNEENIESPPKIKRQKLLIQ